MTDDQKRFILAESKNLSIVQLVEFSGIARHKITRFLTSHKKEVIPSTGLEKRRYLKIHYRIKTKILKCQ